MADTPELISKQELLELAKREGIDVSAHQFDRWRDKGLIVAHREWETPGHGSQSSYSREMLRNLTAISGMLERSRNLNNVGWELWWEGYHVSDKCWIGRFSNPTKVLRFLVRYSERLLKRRDSDDDFAERTSRLKAPLKYVPRSQRRSFNNVNEKGKEDAAASVLWTLAEAISDDDFIFRDEEGTIGKAFAAMAGAKQARTDHIDEDRITVASALPDFLRALSLLRSVPEAQELVSEANRTSLMEARDDVRRILQLTDDFYEAVSWIYGKSAFGLRAAAWYARNRNPTLRAGLTAGWWAIRELGTFLSSDDIQSLAEEARSVRAMSEKLRSIISSDPELQKEITPKRLKAAFQNPKKLPEIAAKIEQSRRR